MLKIIKLISSFAFTHFAKVSLGCFKGNIKVNYYSRFTSNTYIGNNCHFNGMIIRGKGEVTIGDNFHSGSGCKMITSYHDYDNDDYIPYGNKIINKSIVIGKNVWLGDDVLVLGGVSIADGAVIQAGSVVTMNIGYCEIAGGAPAKAFKKRNILHYEKLCGLGKYK